MTSVLWLRRDLRLRDHPALHEAAADGPVVALFVLDQALLRPAGPPRVAMLYRTLRALDAALREHGGGLLVRRGDPVDVVPRAARECGATSVHISADFGPYGRRRDEAVEQALGDGVRLVRTGSPYAVGPGRVHKGDGTPFKVYSPFYRAWREHGWREPASAVAGRVDWDTSLEGVGIPQDPRLPAGLELPEAGEDAALAAWRTYRRSGLARYGDERDRPDLDSTSHMSVHLKWGCIHPRTLLADLGPGDETYRREIAWREFYAAVLHHWPDSARDYFSPQLEDMPYARPDGPAFDAWRQGRTGFPVVDAGMRQLLAQGWMHNRVRMIVASFLVKDLHIEWQHGARHFMQHLVDADLASNQHGWQWTAGTGTDAAPYFRVFNPVTQGQKFDPAGDYVRRWVPELRGAPGQRRPRTVGTGGAAGRVSGPHRRPRHRAQDRARSLPGDPQVKTLIATSAAVTATGAVGGLATGPGSAWYRKLRKPAFQPPQQTFPIVWTSLYALIAGSSAHAIDEFRAAGRGGDADRFAAALGTNLVLNASWSGCSSGRTGSGWPPRRARCSRPAAPISSGARGRCPGARPPRWRRTRAGRRSPPCSPGASPGSTATADPAAPSVPLWPRCGRAHGVSDRSEAKSGW